MVILFCNRIIRESDILNLWYMVQVYRNFRQFTRTADYPHRSFFAKMRKKIQQITRTGR